MLRRLTSLGSDRLSGTLLFLLALFVLWQNRVYPIGTLTEPGAGFLPLLLGLAFAVTTALIAWYGTDALPIKDIGWGEAPRAIAILLACGGAAFIFERLGYRLTIFALLMFLLGFGCLAYLTILWFAGFPIGDRPLLILGVLLVTVGVQLVSTGLLGEMINSTRSSEPGYAVRVERAAQTAAPTTEPAEQEVAARESAKTVAAPRRARVP